ncbi:hypothetical protein ACLOJK_027674 [Asimina triloba]
MKKRYWNINLEELLRARVHLGHDTRKWNPRMAPYISAKRKGSVSIAVRDLQTIPTDGQNFFEYLLEFIRDLSKTQIGEEYGPWVPFIGTISYTCYVNPWKVIID